MPEPIYWGDKPKSAVDNSTVDQEIALKIQSHNDDPDAHLEAGQMMQSHRAAEIIDHLAFSIISEKLAKNFFDDYTIQGSFQSLDCFYYDAYLIDVSLCGCSIVSSTAAEDYNYLLVNSSNGTEIQYHRDPVLEFSIQILNQGDYIAYFGMGDKVGYTDEYVVQFKVENGVLYARMYNFDLDIERLVEIPDVDVTAFNKYRIEYDHLVGASFFVNGVLSAEIPYVDMDQYTPGTPFSLVLSNTTAGNQQFLMLYPFTLLFRA